MRYKMRRIIFILCFIFISATLYAETKTQFLITSKSLIELPDSIDSNDAFMIPDNGICPLVKISIPNIDGLNFEDSSIYKIEQRDGKVLIWMLPGARQIIISSKNMLPNTLKFSEFGYPMLHEATVYALDITIEEESDTLRYRDIIIEKERHKTKKVITYDYEEIKRRFFLSYQYQYGYPFGVSLGICKKYGAYLFFNYWGTDSDWYKNEYRDTDTDVELLSFGGGFMTRLSSHFYLQVGGGFTKEDKENFFLTAGSVLIYTTKKISFGIGYYYYAASAHYKRNVFLDGLTLQIGL